MEFKLRVYILFNKIHRHEGIYKLMVKKTNELQNNNAQIKNRGFYQGEFLLFLFWSCF